MGIVKQEDLIAWRTSNGSIYCDKCGDPDGDAEPLTLDDFEDGDIVICDDSHCKRRIKE